ncbi:MAG: hypothetical protein ACKOSR_08530 [Flavobacteriales bacterium]
MDFTFPQFRKNTTGTSFYQITSASHLLEWQRIGSRLVKHEIEARILPERTLIADLLHCSNGHYIVIDEPEWRLAVESLT